MKKTALLFAFICILLTACSDDDDAPQVAPIVNTGTLTVDGVTTPISNAYMIKPYTGTNPDYDKRRFYVVLTDGTVSLANNDVEFSDNIHQLVDFNLYTDAANAGSLAEDEFKLFIPETGFDVSKAFIDHSSIYTNVVSQNGNLISADEIDSDDMSAGKFNLEQSNGLYTFTFSFSNDEHQISGHYSGTITELTPTYE